MAADESLSDWFARRDQQRASDRQITGTRRALPLAPGNLRASHIAPDAPRLLTEWDGHQWAPVGIAPDAAAAAVFLA
ncbi:DUF6087 family protein [Streptomyces halobius]|uniref:DUF6087 family protein n=1 Tax=Streptomyces halobius TaxID=2879846 RepID=A0ABY4MIB1_9ACTN|nr:DUF6087 family protein [Streptomyces halobius]UQA97549.1 DUF6087 family protein [Streptomyces halobius]